jgi:hypothetical protein
MMSRRLHLLAATAALAVIGSTGYAAAADSPAVTACKHRIEADASKLGAMHYTEAAELPRVRHWRDLPPIVHLSYDDARYNPGQSLAATFERDNGILTLSQLRYQSQDGSGATTSVTVMCAVLRMPDGSLKAKLFGQ